MKFLVIANPTAAASTLLKRLVDQMGWEVLVSQRAGHSRELAAQVAPGRAVLAAGGDGTLHEVVNGLVDRHGPLGQVGLIPLGTGNDVARSLGIPRDFAGILAMCQNPHWRQLDLGCLSSAPGTPETYFVSSATIGFSAQTSVTAHGLRGYVPRPLLFLAAVLWDIVRRRHATTRSGTCQTESKTVHLKQFFNVNLANLSRYGGGMIAAPAASGWDGQLDLVTMDFDLWGATLALPETYRGRFDRVAGVNQVPFQTVNVETSEPTPVQADGEFWGYTPVKCRLVPNAVSFMLPT